ncbi:MAG: class I SAM-dependent methyltransferase [Candidatus Bipolaricaulota bacterium]
MGLALGLAFGAASLLWVGWNLTLDALWQPTDRVTVRRLLLLAAVKTGERVVDLGCGDGRIVVAAARDFGANATGVEIDPFRVAWAWVAIALAGVLGRARVAWGNMYAFDVSQADVVILFLSATSNFKLQERIRRELRPGARVVSYYHPIWGWEPDLIGEARDGYPIYVYRMAEAS